MINPPPERRKYPRLEKNIPVKLSSDEFDVVTETRNLSCAGAYCRVNKYFEPMTKLGIHLLLPIKRDSKIVTKKISCRGVVVRIESQAGNEYFNIAIYFNDIAKKDTKCLADYISSTLTKK